MSFSRQCDICHNGYAGPDPKRAVHRYSIRRYSPNQAGDKPQNSGNRYQGKFESAGSIDLCFRCWNDICKPRMRPQRQPRTIKNGSTDVRPNPNLRTPDGEL